MTDDQPPVLMHTCQACGDQFRCDDEDHYQKIDGCCGPYCMLCWHGLWTIRFSKGVDISIRMEQLMEHEQRGRGNAK